MKLYYTGAVKYLGEQKDSSLSIGGLVSSTEIPNGVLANLFGSLSRFTIQQNKPEFRAIVIKNDGDTVLSGVKAYFTYPQTDDSPATDDNDSEFLIGYSDMLVSDSGDLSVEKLSSIYATPYTVTMNEGAVGEENALDLPDLDPGSYLGIFIKRVLKSSTQLPVSDSDLEAILDGTLVPSKQEDIGLTFSWD